MANPPNGESDRERRARELAFEEGKHREKIDAHLRAHDTELKELKIALRETKQSHDQLARKLETLDDAIERLSTQEEIRNRTQAGIAKAISEANAKQITTRQFGLGVAGIILTLIGLVLAQGHFFSKGVIEPLQWGWGWWIVGL